MVFGMGVRDVLDWVSGMHAVERGLMPVVWR